MKLFTITIDSDKIARSIRRGTCGRGKGGSFPFRDRSKYNRKKKHKKEVDC